MGKLIPLDPYILNFLFSYFHFCYLLFMGEPGNTTSLREAERERERYREAISCAKPRYREAISCAKPRYREAITCAKPRTDAFELVYEFLRPN